MRLRWPRRLEVGSSRPRFPPLRAYVTASRVSAPTVLFQNKLRRCGRLRPSAARERPKRLLGC
jgi:hypothetical protein